MIAIEKHTSDLESASQTKAATARDDLACTLVFLWVKEEKHKSGVYYIVFIYFWKEHESVFTDHQEKLTNRILYEIQTRFFMALKISPK